MYQPDPEAVLRVLADRLAPGGVMAFLEMNMNPPDPLFMWPEFSGAAASKNKPPFPLGRRRLGGTRKSETSGTRLPSMLRSAGLEPQLPYEVTGAAVTGDDAVLQFLLAMLVGVAQVLTGNGIASEEEVDIEYLRWTCQGRNRPRSRSGSSPGPSLAVWARKP